MNALPLAPREARNYALRWGIAAAVLTELIIFAFWGITGRMPIVDRIRVTPHQDYMLPFHPSRWFDGLGVIIPVFIVAYMWFRNDEINRRWAKTKWTRHDATTPIVFGIIIGLLSLAPTIPAGFGGIAIATPIALLLIIAGSRFDPAHPYQVVLCCLVVILTMWASATLLVGSVAGFAYAMATFLYTAGIVVGVAGALAAIFATFILLGVVGQGLLYGLLLPKRMRPAQTILDALKADFRDHSSKNQEKLDSGTKAVA